MNLVDNFGRVHTDLRLSLTDRCNLRCTYCMPAEGVEWTPGPHLLRPDEMERLVRIGTELGIRSVRLTGGEPSPAYFRKERLPSTHGCTPLAINTAMAGMSLGVYW